MRMSELSDRSGVAIPSIKFYQREGLLPGGERTSANQAQYDEGHLARLALVRALIDVGGLSVSSARAVLAAIGKTEMPVEWVFGVAQRAASKSIPLADVVPSEAAFAEVDALSATRGWAIDAHNPGRPIAARVVETYRAMGHDALIAGLGAYADAADIVAAADLGAVASVSDRAAKIETVVVGTVLGDTLFAGLRRMAQQSLSQKQYLASTETADVPTDCEEDVP